MTAPRAHRTAWLLTLLISCACQAPLTSPMEPNGMQIHYLEIVTNDRDATCDTLAAQHGVTFGEPDADLAGARLAELAGGGSIGVRTPVADGDMQIVRHYRLVDDIEAALRTAESAGAVIAMPATEVPGGRGSFAIYFHGDIQHGLWQL